MALDEPKEEDAIYDLNGVKYIIRKALLDMVQPVKVDFYSSLGFRISSSMDRGTGCSTCGSSAGCS